MKDLERENVRLKRLVADLSLEKQILKDVASKFVSPERRRQGAARTGKVRGLSTSCLPVCRSATERSVTPPLFVLT